MPQPLPACLSLANDSSLANSRKLDAIFPKILSSYGISRMGVFRDGRVLDNICGSEFWRRKSEGRGSGGETGALRVVGHLLLDGECKLKRLATFSCGDGRLAAGVNGAEKRLQFEAQRFAGSDGGFVEVKTGQAVDEILGGSGAHGGFELKVLIDGDDESVAAGVVDGDVSSRLEVAELADALGGDARSSEVGDASGVEFDADVGDVHFAGEDGQTDGAEIAHRAGGEAEHDVEIVDHEIEDDIDIEGARGEDAEAVRLKEHGSAEVALHGEDGGIEAFEMSGLKDASVTPGEGDELVGLGERSGEGFFDEAVDAGGEKLRGDGAVMDGGHGDDGSVESEIGRERGIDGGEDGNAVAFGDRGGARRIRLNGGDEGSLGHLAEDAQMVAPEGSGADHGDARRMDCGRQSGLASGDDGEASAVEVEKLVDLIFGLGRRRTAEAGGRRCGTAEAGAGGDEFQQVERDIFVAARAGAVEGEFFFHGKQLPCRSAF